MKRRFWLKALIAALVLAAIIAAIYFGLRLVPDPSKRELLATLTGAAATVFAGWLAWASVMTQVARADAERLARAEARKLDAVVAITQPVHAAAAWLALLKRDLSQSGDRDGRSLRAKRGGRQLDQVLDRDLVLALLDDMSANDRADLLMIVGTMRAALAMTQINVAEEVLSVDDRRRIRDAISSLSDHLQRFDEELLQIFNRGTATPISE